MNTEPTTNDYRKIDSEEFEDNNDSASPVEPDEIPREKRNLQTASYDRPVKDIISAVKEEEYILDPDYQRNYVWDDAKASQLIESILLSVPIPAIYLAENEDKSQSIIDGLQRINSLYRFYNNEYKLKKLTTLFELNGEQYSTLSTKAKRMIDYTLMRIIVIKSESHPDIKYDVFMRLNQGAVALNEQELRNCLYRGQFCKAIKDISTSAQYLSVMNKKEPNKRLLDSELALRMVALSECFNPETLKLTKHRHKMDKLLNNFMSDAKALPDAQVNAMRDESIAVFSLINSTLGVDAFKRKIEKNTRLNRAIVDIIYYAFLICHRNGMQASALKDIHSKIEERIVSDQFLKESIVSFTSEPLRIEARLSAAIDITTSM